MKRKSIAEQTLQKQVDNLEATIAQLDNQRQLINAEINRAFDIKGQIQQEIQRLQKQREAASTKQTLQKQEKLKTVG